jgi:hypothetical protein
MVKGIVIVFVALLWTGPAFGAHPLITDDTGTQGKGKFQFEFIGEYGHDDEDGVTTKSLLVPTVPVLSYGMTDTMDIVLGTSYEYRRAEDREGASKVDGVTDTSVELKWRCYEREGLSLALKPGITFPTGNDEKGLGSGKVTYSLFLIATYARSAGGPFLNGAAFHLNLGYRRNENRVDERRDIWHASLAGETEIAEGLRVVANIGMERNADKSSSTPPVFLLGGIIYSVSENLDIDLGIKGGLTRPETDYSILTGITWRF